ncbi:MAG: hypothetical protein Q8O34_10265 [Rhodocyclaceae bacterium]|nr:hypothetical protein [Rhodocyclaceae bacterium]
MAKGEVAFWFLPVAGAMAGIREGKLVALAVTGEKLAKMGAEAMSMTPSQFARFVRGETEAI